MLTGMPRRARCPFCNRLFDRARLDAHVQRCRTKQRVIDQPRTVRRTVVVDGNNVAYYLSPDGRPHAKNLVLALKSLISAHLRPIVVVSAALKHNVPDPSYLGELSRLTTVIEAPAGRDDDFFVIQLAQQHNADIVSNDRFLDWLDSYPWIASRLRRYRMTPSGLILI